MLFTIPRHDDDFPTCCLVAATKTLVMSTKSKAALATLRAMLLAETRDEGSSIDRENKCPKVEYVLTDASNTSTINVNQNH